MKANNKIRNGLSLNADAKIVCIDRTKKDFVYFVQDCSSNNIKIGVSKDVKKRIKSLQTASSSNLVLMGQLLGGRSLEKFLHKVFARYRVKREWFKPAAPILNFISQYCDDRNISYVVIDVQAFRLGTCNMEGW